eukprot:753399-Hanusia_phi.AAC.5
MNKDKSRLNEVFLSTNNSQHLEVERWGAQLRNWGCTWIVRGRGQQLKGGIAVTHQEGWIYQKRGSGRYGTRPGVSRSGGMVRDRESGLGIPASGLACRHDRRAPGTVLLRQGVSAGRGARGRSQTAAPPSPTRPRVFMILA